MRILLAIDESSCSEQAIREVEQRFRTSIATVRVLHAVPRFVPPAAALLDAGGSPQAAHAEVLAQYQNLVDAVAARLQGQGITAEGIVKDGDPGKVIVKEAGDWDADLIIMGSHGYGRLKRMIVGSVSQYVVDQAPCSVEIVHQKEVKGNE